MTDETRRLADYLAVSIHNGSALEFISDASVEFIIYGGKRMKLSQYLFVRQMSGMLRIIIKELVERAVDDYNNLLPLPRLTDTDNGTSLAAAAARAVFHQHLEVCSECRSFPASLCASGRSILLNAEPKP